MPSPPIIDAARVLPRLERLLAGVVVPYWFPDKIDPAGGFRLNHGNDDRWRGAGEKHLVTQGRMTLAAARLVREGDELPAGIDLATVRAAADHGFAFLRDRFWDQECEGVYWSLAADGTPRRTEKHLLAQATALAAFAEYARATGSSEAADMARRAYTQIEFAHDRQFGGYVELFQRDWSASGPGAPRLVGTAPGLKTAGTHLHVLIALSHYMPIAEDGPVRERLIELILVMTTTILRQRHGFPTEPHARNWRSVRDASGHRASYGHIVEMAWWVPAAAIAAGLPAALVAGYSRALLDKVIDDGLDRGAGGLFAEGPIDGPADRLDKEWWAQVEALRAFAEWHRWTDDMRFASTFLDILRWTEDHQVDTTSGDFHATIRSDGTSAGDKAGAWKCPYHQVVSLLGAIRMMYANAPAFVV